MIFKPKGFFLNLDKDAPAKPAAVAPVQPAAAAKGKAEAKAQSEAKPEAKAAPSAPSAPTEGRVLTTAEAIAAELRREQEAMPAPSATTFAPDRLLPAGALPRRRRRAGANLAPFKAIAGSLLRS